MKRDSRKRPKPWVKQNHPPEGEPWIWLTMEMLESPAWQVLSSAARDVVFRIAIEHMGHAGTENGNLVVTYDDFERYGIRRSSISAAIREAERLGWIVVTLRGRGGNSEFRRASRYALSWLPMSEGPLARNPWKCFDTVEKANAARPTKKTSSRKAQRLAA